MIYCAAVEKIEERRKPEDFFGHRKRAYPKFHAVDFHHEHSLLTLSGLKSLDFSPLFLFALSYSYQQG